MSFKVDDRIQIDTKEENAIKMVQKYGDKGTIVNIISQYAEHDLKYQIEFKFLIRYWFRGHELIKICNHCDKKIAQQ